MLIKVKAKAKALVVSLSMWLITAQAVMAEGIEKRTAEEVSGKVVKLAQDYLLPFAGAVIFITIVFAAFKIITTANKPQDRAEAMKSLPYIFGGGMLLGAASMVAGLVLGSWEHLK